MTILLDSGIRSGADAFKALALGADAVLIGRPYLWGLALDGQTGVVSGAITDQWWRVSYTISGTNPSFLFAVAAGVGPK